jgi:hypothetical protein
MKRRIIATSVAVALAVIGGGKAVWSRQEARGFP